MTIIGLTGPTGAGKGVVAAALKARGACVIDTDKLAREVVEPGEPCLAALVDAFGEDILQGDGTLDRAALAAKAFATKEAGQLLNSITHPAIIARSRGILETCKAPVAVIDAPLLFESGMDVLCHLTVGVLAPAGERLARIMARDHISAARAQARMNAQPNDDFYRTRCSHILHNTGSIEDLLCQVDRWIETAWEVAT